MAIKYAPNYKKENTLFICVHHSGGIENNPLASTKLFTADTIDKAHQTKWNYKSSLGYYGGYNFFCDYWGNVIQFRAVGEETMAQKGYNFNGQVVSICLAGNFTKGVDVPSEAQKMALEELIRQFPQVPNSNIVPHRHFRDTECYGNSLSDDWARNLPDVTYTMGPDIEEQKKTLLKKIIELYQLIIKKLLLN